MRHCPPLGLARRALLLLALLLPVLVGCRAATEPEVLLDCDTVRSQVAELRATARALRVAASSLRSVVLPSDPMVARDAADSLDRAAATIESQADAQAVLACAPYDDGGAA